MTIDTKELRRLAQEAMHPATKGRWMRLFGERTVYDRMEDGCRGIPVVSTPVSPPHPFEAACLDFIAAANPATISELLDRLEAAEREVAHVKEVEFPRKVKAVADIWAGKCERLEKENEALRINLDDHRALVSDLRKEVEKLRTKIEAMERPSVPEFANTKDAARYRWLRENGLASEKRESRAVLPRSGKKASMAFRYWTTPEELDMTIDAALAAAPELGSPAHGGINAKNNSA